ncbi:MAG: tRNA pseudouridine(13) synthase TruD [Methanobacteriota archaeon]|nr:MAG: tRNA pseudouridine(13) synthase TruD [Euryarchaeota archaeon]
MDEEYRFYGIGRYSTNLTPIEGRIKKRPSDFIVEELNDEGMPVSSISYTTEAGAYLVILAIRENMAHHRMVRKLARFFRVSPDDIGTGGIKDKKAIVTQMVSVFEPRKNVDFEEFILEPGLLIRNLGWRKKGVVKGHIGGNQFRIVIRDTIDLSNEMIQSMTKELSEAQLLNFYGPQRFGGMRPVNSKVGRAIFERDFETAVKLYVGEPSLKNIAENEYRNLFRETLDPELVLSQWVGINSEEKAILEWLIRRPNDYEGAIYQLPKSMISLLRRSFISYLWNRYLTNRFTTGILKGERLVSLRNKKNIEVALPSGKWPKPLNEIWEEVFDSLNLNVNLFRSEKHTTRFLFMNQENLTISPSSRNSLQISFSLTTGQYATVLLREVMRSPLQNYI